MLDYTYLTSVFSNFRNLGILVIGDLMIDTYLWGEVKRISPEAPVPIVEIEKSEDRLGGAGNVINNLIALQAKVDLTGVIDQRETGELIANILKNLGISTCGLIRDPQKISSKKTRIISSSNNQQLLRIDDETVTPATPEQEMMIAAYLRGRVQAVDAVLISDYLKGVVTPGLMAQIIAIAHEYNKPVIIDPKGKDYNKYRGATIITPNKLEAETATGIKITDRESLEASGRKLLQEQELAAVLVTLGKDGMALFEPGKETRLIPAKAKEVYDVTGAGDTVVSLLATCIASGMDFENAATISNIAAGLVVGKFGTAVVTTDEVLKAIGNGNQFQCLDKTIGLEALLPIVATEKKKGKTIVFTNGCFDLLHAGHTEYLQKARAMGDILILGLNSDASIKRLKGETRPIIAEAQRASILSALQCVDYIVIFDEDTPIRLIEAIVPHILAKGKDYEGKEVVGREVVEKNGGRVELVELVQGVSTSTIIGQIHQK